ncbi:MAG TPA: cytochrome c [Afifellaceae bacterium]|nr:cytochrome c [Afifellaceae bacterium]
MSKFHKVAATALILALAGVPAFAGKFNLGRVAAPEEIAGWDIDVRPDGTGLPEGSGTVSAGEAIFLEKCAACHGDFAEGVDRWPVLAGGMGTLKSDNPVKTLGSYWPYLSTGFDYINRTMPFGDAQSLEADEVYALLAYILYMNDVIQDENFELSKKNFLSVKMPNEDGFIEDSRPDTPTLADDEPCMENCKPEVKITGRARVIDVTPDDEENPSGSID